MKKLSEVNEQYIGAIIDYCKSHQGCKYCSFKTEEDEIGDSCPFYVQPMYYEEYISGNKEKHNCYTCGHAEGMPGSFHCMLDDVEIMPCEAGEECKCWIGE